MIVRSLASALVFVACAYASTRASALLCRDLVPFDDGPRPSRAPVGALLAAAGVVGAALGAHGVTLAALTVGALLVVALVACTYSDFVCGLVPDRFTVVPLALVGVWSLFARDASPLVAALVVAFPFAGAALLSKGLGMGWGDVKLAALVGAVVGIAPAILAFACACALAGAIAVARGRTREPIALVPYLSSFAAIALVWSP